jgi:predicted HAD superfamily Cof-like phosphohydrolase
MRSLMRDVAKFHEKFGVRVGTTPSPISEKDAELRISLIDEEAEELCDAILHQDLVKIADGVGDLIYVAIGAALEFGIDMQPVWAAIQTTNMLKQGGAKRWDGKIMKPEGWQPPQIDQILSTQVSLVEKLKEDQ